MEEIWKKVENYEGLYVSNLGRVKDSKGNYKSTYINNKGYHCLSIYDKYSRKTKHPLLHRLVAVAFLDNPLGFNQINHIDTNKNNNKSLNLEWCNQKDNYIHGMNNFLYSHNEEHYFAKLTNEQVKAIPDLYKLGFIRSTIAKILGVNPASIEAIEKGISYRELKLNFNFPKTKYKDLPNIKLPSYIWNIFKDNTVLNTLISEGKVSV